MFILLHGDQYRSGDVRVLLHPRDEADSARRDRYLIWRSFPRNGRSGHPRRCPGEGACSAQGWHRGSSDRRQESFSVINEADGDGTWIAYLGNRMTNAAVRRYRAHDRIIYGSTDKEPSLTLIVHKMHATFVISSTRNLMMFSPGNPLLLLLSGNCYGV